MNTLMVILFFLISSRCFSEGHTESKSDNFKLKILDSTKSTEKIPSNFVQFSPVKPQLAPILEAKRSSSSSSSKSAQHLLEDSCPTVSEWVTKSHALDLHGNEVSIAQRISLNGTVMNQYFYETYCASNIVYEYDDFFGTSLQRSESPESIQCKGIDTDRYDSHCRESYIWTYGNVMRSNGQIGWSIIAIRGSCSCAIWPKETSSGSPLSTSSDFSNSGSNRGRRLTSNSKSSTTKSKYRLDPFF